MKISTGFIIIFVCIAIFAFASFVMEMLYPKPQQAELCAWYGEIHFEPHYELPVEYENPFNPRDHYKFKDEQPKSEPKDDKAAE